MPKITSEEIKGFAYPFSFTKDGHLAKASTSDKLLANIKNIVETTFDSRVMRPDMGTDLTQFLFKRPTDDDLFIIEDRVKEAISRFEPRVEIASLNASYLNDEIQVSLSFRIKGLGFQTVYRGSISVG